MSSTAQKIAKSLPSYLEPTAAALLASIGGRFADDCPSLATLIARHDEAKKADEHLWNAVSDIADLPQMEGRPFPKVQIGRLYRGRDDDNKEIWEATYGYHEDHINRQIDQHMDGQLAMCPGEKMQSHRDTISAGYENYRARVLGELRAQKAERQRIEDEAGYTDAMAAANLASDAVRRIEADILRFEPTSLSDAALKAGFVVRVYCEEQGGYIDQPEQLVEALAAIGRALA